MKKTGIKKGKRISKIVCALMCMGMLLTGCGDSGSKKIMFKGEDSGQNTTEDSFFGGFGSDNNAGNAQESIALSDYIMQNQPCILYVNRGKENYRDENDSSTPESHQPPAKDEEPEGFYYFHDNVVTMYDTKLTWGEISRMTDEEIIAGSKEETYALNTEYKFVVYTDATGNNLDGESIIVKEEYDGKIGIFDGHSSEPYFTAWMTTGYGNCQIYDTTFVGWNATCAPRESGAKSVGRPTFWFKKVDERSISLDKPDSPNVVVDPECYNDRRIKEDIFE